MTAPGGGTTAYTYDALGHLETVTAPLGRLTTYDYDANGNWISEKDAELNRLKTVTYAEMYKNDQYMLDFVRKAWETGIWP